MSRRKKIVVLFFIGVQFASFKMFRYALLTVGAAVALSFLIVFVAVVSTRSRSCVQLAYLDSYAKSECKTVSDVILQSVVRLSSLRECVRYRARARMQGI